MTQIKHRALVYRNEGMAVRLLTEYGTICDTPEEAFDDARRLRKDYPNYREFYIYVATSDISPNHFPHD